MNETPGVSPGLQLAPPETATTVRVQDAKALITDGPFAETKEALVVPTQGVITTTPRSPADRPWGPW